MKTKASENDDEGEAVRKLQLVLAGTSQYGIFAEEISVIVPWQEPAPLPHASKAVLGVVSVEGRMLTVLDLATLAVGEGGSGAVPRNAAAYLIALRGDEQLALAVDAVAETITLTSSDLIPDSSARPEAMTALLLEVREHAGAELKILNVKGLFQAAIQGRQRRQRRF